MKFVLTNTTLRSFVATIIEMADDGMIECSQDGWRMKAVDPANVAMVDASIPASAFDHYEMNGSERGNIPIDLSTLEDRLKVFDPSSPVAISLDEGKLVISADNLRYKVGLLDPSTIRKPPKVPDLDLPAKVVLDGATFQKSIKAISSLSDVARMRIIADEETDVFVMEGKGDIDTVVLKMPAFELRGFKPGIADSRISVDYLKDISKSIKGADEVEIWLGRDYPMDLRTAVGDVRVKYLVAPRVEKDD